MASMTSHDHLARPEVTIDKAMIMEIGTRAQLGQARQDGIFNNIFEERKVLPSNSPLSSNYGHFP